MNTPGDISIEEYNESYFAERDYLPAYLESALRLLLKRYDCKQILEVGVGSGLLMKRLREIGYDVEGIDISPVSAKLTGAKIASATSIPYSQKTFDCVLGISIIEHLTESEGEVFIDEARRVLRPGGILFIITPNKASPLKQIQGKKWFAYQDKTHVYFYSPRSLKRLLHKKGFRNLKCTFNVESADLEWPLPKIAQRIPKKAKIIINKILISTPIAEYRDSFWISGQI